MSRPLTVYGGTYDGRNRVIVAAPTKKAAYEAISAVMQVGTYATWNNYTADTGNTEEVDVATSEPLTVFSRDKRRGSHGMFAPIRKAPPITTFCVDCRHVHEDSRKRSPTQWLCNRHKRLEGMGFVHPQYWTNEEPFLKCHQVNGGACPLFEPIEAGNDR